MRLFLPETSDLESAKKSIESENEMSVDSKAHVDTTSIEEQTIMGKYYSFEDGDEPIFCELMGTPFAEGEDYFNLHYVHGKINFSIFIQETEKNKICMILYVSNREPLSDFFDLLNQTAQQLNIEVEHISKPTIQKYTYTGSANLIEQLFPILIEKNALHDCYSYCQSKLHRLSELFNQSYQDMRENYSKQHASKENKHHQSFQP